MNRHGEPPSRNADLVKSTTQARHLQTKTHKDRSNDNSQDYVAPTKPAGGGKANGVLPKFTAASPFFRQTQGNSGAFWWI